MSARRINWLRGVTYYMAARLFWFFVGTILYTYLGYPLLLTILNRRRSKPGHLKSHQVDVPSVTLLVAAYNEQDVIGEKLENCLSLDYPRDQLQIIVAADGSDDRTPDIVRLYAAKGVELSFSPPRKGKMAAINRAMEMAKGDIVVFSDANNFYDVDTIRHLVAPFADATVGVVTGAKSVVRGDSPLGESEGLYWQYESFIKEQETMLGCCTGFSGEILAIRRMLFEAAPEYVINDDFYISMRIVKQGYRVAYAPQARSYERVSPTAEEEVQRRARINAGWFQSIAMGGQVLPWRKPVVTWQVISHKYLRPLLPWAMIGAAVTNVWAVVRPAPADGCRLLRLAAPMNWILLVLQTAFYLVALLGGSTTRREGRLGSLLYVPAFLVNSNIAAIIGLYRFIMRKQTPLWQRARRQHERAPRPGRS